MKLLGISSQKSSAVSLDLLNLYVVNQIATKKDHTDRVQKPIYVEMNRGIKNPLRRHNVELPKSPEHRPLKPFLDDVQHRVQQEVLENRRKYLLEKGSFQYQSASSSQLSNITCEDVWIPKAACQQGDISNPEGGTPNDQYFQQLNRLGYSTTFGKSPMGTTDVDSENNHREAAMLSIMHDTLKTTEDESSQTIAALLDEDHQPFLTIPSSPSCHSFANKNILDQLFTDADCADEISNICHPYNREEIHQKTSCDRHSSERDLKSILTAPEQISFSSSQSLNVVGPENTKNQLKDCYLQEGNPVIYPGLQDTTIDFTNSGGMENQNKNIKVADPMENYLKKARKDGLAEQKLNQLQIFRLEETETEVFSCCDQQSKQGTKHDDESQLSNCSPSYSPKQIDGYTGSTSDESEKEEEEASHYFEDAFLRNYDTPVPGSHKSQWNCQSTNMYSNLLEHLSRKTEGFHPQTKPPLGLGKDKLCRAGTEFSKMLFGKTHYDFKPSHDAWSQTETCGRDSTTKADAGVQCDIMQACGCKNELSSVHSAEIVTSTSKTETTGGQNIPTDRALSQLSSSSNFVFSNISPKAEYFVVHDKTRLGIIDFISVMNEGKDCD
ncbi:hypothetical protein JRQ81_015775 [Phrynocephalus forsythii]|uniref:Uncharacterized protein n=1 Tax=Phrynocephalus forsythii TaxID=171643 RepID=A0A9Q1B1Q9_9SAUR|nr:hypothetical protein JRQ81_015775 [Phrynocephalus forsythii]